MDCKTNRYEKNHTSKMSCGKIIAPYEEYNAPIGYCLKGSEQYIEGLGRHMGVWEDYIWFGEDYEAEEVIGGTRSEGFAISHGLHSALRSRGLS